MKKVLFVATVTDHINGFHIPYLKMFKEKGYEVHVASFGEEPIEYCDKHFNIPFARFPFKWQNYKAYKELKEIINNNEYEIIHCHTPVGGVLTRLAAKKARKKGTRVIYTAHGFHFYKGAPILNWIIYYPIEKYLAKYTDCLITINEEDYELAKKKFKAKQIEFVHGVGVDEKKFNFTMSDDEKEDLRKSLDLKKDDFVISYVAELSKRKNQGMLIRATSELINKEKIKNIKVLLVGTDSLNNYYQQMARDLNVEDNIMFLGYRKDIPKLLKISDLYVSTSTQEGLPINLVEAAMCKLPIIATNCRGNRNVASELIEMNNIEQLCESINNAIEKNESYLFSEYSKYGLTNVLNEMKKIYNLEEYINKMNIKEVKQMPNISIIMGIYNCGKYLKESIDSVLSQTFKSWELIMCDDGSTDNTYNIAKEYQEKYPDKIILLRNDKNLGLNETLNNCLKKAKGKYIARQDGDDVSVEDRLEKEYTFLEEHPEYALVSSSMIYFDETGEWGQSKPKQIPKKDDFVIGPPFAHPAAMIRKKVLDEVGWYTVDKKLLRVEDYHLWFKIYAKGYIGYNLSEPLYKMRDNSEAYKRRTWNSRVNSFRLRLIGYKMLGIPFYKYIYCIRPILIYLLPNKLYDILHKKKLSKEKK